MIGTALGGRNMSMRWETTALARTIWSTQQHEPQPRWLTMVATRTQQQQQQQQQHRRSCAGTIGGTSVLLNERCRQPPLPSQQQQQQLRPFSSWLGRNHHMTNWDPRLLLSSSSSSSSHRFFPWPLPRFFMTTCTTPSIGRAIDPSSSSSLQLRSDGCCCNPPSSVLGMGCCGSRHYGGCNQSNRRSFTTTIIDDSQQKSRDVTEAKESSIEGLATGSTSVPIPNNEGQEEENDKKKNSASSGGDVGKLFSPNALLPMSLLQLELKYSDGKAPQVVMIPSGVTVAYAMGLLRKSEGFLQDTHGLLLADEEVLTSEGAPYVFNVVSPQGLNRQQAQELFRQQAQESQELIRQQAQELQQAQESQELFRQQAQESQELIRQQAQELQQAQESQELTRQQVTSLRQEFAKRPKYEAPERILSYITKSHAFSDAKTAGRVTFGHNFFFPLDDPVATPAFSQAGPDSKKDENSIHHPYFFQEVQKLVDAAVAAGRIIRQQLLWTYKGHWLSLDDKTVAGVAPDFVTMALDISRKMDDRRQFYVGTTPEKPSKYDVAMAFEQKKSFVEVDQLEVIDYAERILRIQHGRKVVYTALFHCNEDEMIIRWLRVVPGDGHYVTEISRPESLAPTGLGQRQLLTMLCKTSKELGRCFPVVGPLESGQRVKVSRLLGFGATADVYLGSVDDSEGVLKVFKDHFKYLADHEARTLAHLSQSETPFVSHGVKIKEGVVFFEEILEPIRTITARHVSSLVECLEHSHTTARVVHRDVRPENIMQRGDGEVRLIDWAVAHAFGATDPPFSGTFRYASNNVLDAVLSGASRTPKPEDDLESFVRVVFAMTIPTLRKRLAEIKDGDFVGAKALWGEFKEQNPEQDRMFAAASSLNYDALKHILPGFNDDVA